MDLYEVNELLEQFTGDENDVDTFGMDVMTRKRLKVGRMMQKKKVKPRKPMRSKMPYSMARIPKLPAGEEMTMSTLRKRGYLEESVEVAKREDSSTAEQGSYQRIMAGYYKGVIDRISKGLPSSFVKKGTKAASSADYYRGRVNGESENFEWSVSVRNDERDRGSTGDVRIIAQVGPKRMVFVVEGSSSPDEFVKDVVGWMTSKEVVRAR